MGQRCSGEGRGLCSYQSTNSVVFAEPVAAGVWATVLDLVEGLVEGVEKVLAFGGGGVAVGIGLLLVMVRVLEVAFQGEDAGYAAHDG